MKIVVLDDSALNPGDLDLSCLKQFGSCEIYPVTPTEAETISRIEDAEIVLTNKTPMTEAIFRACPNIRFLGVMATGYNVVDCRAAKRRGIPVCNVPSYGTAAVAQYTMALLLEICHQIGYHDRIVHQGAWVSSPVFSFWATPQSELAGKTMGIIGFGRIGQATAKLAQAFGMEVIAYSRRPFESEFAKSVSLEELLEKADVVSLHCPLFPETEKLINDSTIARMKDGAILLNTSRGQLVDEDALARALESGKLRFAAVDVVSREPMLATNPLLNAPNCIITPHMAWAPVESRQRLLDCVVENIRCFLAGHPQNVVNS